MSNSRCLQSRQKKSTSLYVRTLLISSKTTSIFSDMFSINKSKLLALLSLDIEYSDRSEHNALERRYPFVSSKISFSLPILSLASSFPVFFKQFSGVPQQFVIRGLHSASSALKVSVILCSGESTRFNVLDFGEDFSCSSHPSVSYGMDRNW